MLLIREGVSHGGYSNWYSDSATVRVYEAIADGLITPLYHKDILDEYAEVLSSPNFRFSSDKVDPVHYLRINATLAQFEEFDEFYDIREGDGMYLSPEDRVAVW